MRPGVCLYVLPGTRTEREYGVLGLIGASPDWPGTIPLPRGKRLEDNQLVDGLIERRDSDVQVFLERYRPLFYHCIAHFEANDAAREDLFQDLVLYVL